MCGIIGITSAKDNVSEKILKGLKYLEYRGYDSSGLAIYTNNQIHIRRSVGKIDKLQELLKAKPIDGCLGIGHTRWATHGSVTIENTHPHSNDRIALVHNGIIENYTELKSDLHSVSFQSQTDTEVIVYLLDRLCSESVSEFNAVIKLMSLIRGAFSLAIIFQTMPETIFAIRHGSPMVVGRNQTASFLGSDVLALSSWVDEYAYLEEGEIAVLNPRDISFFNFQGEHLNKSFSFVDFSKQITSKEPYRHYMLKEIYEQPTVLRSILNTYVERPTHTLKTPPLPWGDLQAIHILGCGTSNYSGLTSKYWFEHFANLRTIPEIASEFRYRNPVIYPNELGLFISQSGETIDTLSCLRFLKNNPKCSLVNVEKSSMAKESEQVMLLHAGPEIGVASTKAFTAQLMCLALLSLQAGVARGHLSSKDRISFLEDLFCVPAYIEDVLGSVEPYQVLASKISNTKSVLFMGRGVFYPIALEGALKLKEISYIHASGYAGGELKHGPIALIDSNVSVVVLAPFNESFFKIHSNIQEAMARGGNVIVFTDEPDKVQAKHVIAMPKGNDWINPFLYATAMQLISYFVGLEKGTDIDQPRNLAKSVTVE